MRKRLLAGIARLLGTMLLAGLLGATLVRVAPGFGFDAAALDPNLSEQSRAAIRQQHEAERNIFTFYFSYISSLARGEWGTSISLNQPVRDLVRDRLPVTVRTMGYSIVIGWLLAVVIAGLIEVTRSKSLILLSTVSNAGLLSAPAAVLALLCLMFRWPPTIAITAIVFAYLFSYATSVFRDHFSRPHVLSAMARGAGKMRLLCVHVFSSAAPELLTLLGLSVATAFAAALPIEVISDTPGIGQLAWQGALGRDVRLVITLTMLVTFLSVAATVAADITRDTIRERAQ
jgi:peptide/nickel transport system permease protein